jgi:hypothetical protein
MLKPHGFVVTSRTCGTAFASLKKCPLEADFFNSGYAGTKPKEAPYVTTGNNLKFQKLTTLKLKLVLYFSDYNHFCHRMICLLKRLQLLPNLMLIRRTGTSCGKISAYKYLKIFLRVNINRTFAVNNTFTQQIFSLR